MTVPTAQGRDREVSFRIPVTHEVDSSTGMLVPRAGYENEQVMYPISAPARAPRELNARLDSKHVREAYGQWLVRSKAECSECDLPEEDSALPHILENFWMILENGQGQEEPPGVRDMHCGLCGKPVVIGIDEHSARL